MIFFSSDLLRLVCEFAGLHRKYFCKLVILGETVSILQCRKNIREDLDHLTPRQPLLRLQARLGIFTQHDTTINKEF